MRIDPYAKERAEARRKKVDGTSAVEQFFGTIMQQAKGQDGKTPKFGIDFLTPAEMEAIKVEIIDRIPKAKDGEDPDYDLILKYVVTEVEKEVKKEVAKLPKPKDGKPGKDAVVDIPAIVDALLKVMPKMDDPKGDSVDYMGIKDYIDKQVSKIKVQAPLMRNGGTNSLRQLTDVVLDGLETDSKGNYILSGGASVSDEAYGGTWDGVTDEAPSKNAVYDKIQALSLGAGTGDVVGPVSSVNNRIATFDGTTGKLIKDSGSVVGDFATSAQGAKADTATQPADIANFETTSQLNTRDTNNRNTDNHTSGTTNKVYTATEQTKLAGIATGATANSADATLLARANHTGTQTASTISDFDSAVAATASVTANTAKVSNATHTGDVTGATALTIASGAVTLAKMANLAQDQFIGRVTASTGVPETATITSAARTVLDDTSVANMVNTLGGATSTGSGGLVRATSPTLVTPALGTPSSGVLTNCTGTASGLTAGTVTTNANLTGVVTSVGNATAIADNALSIAKTSGLQTALDAKLDATAYDDATSAETNTGTSTTKYVSPDALAGSNLGIRYVAVTLNGTTALTTSEKAYYRIPAALTGMNLVSVSATVGTGATGSSSSGTPTFTVKNVTDNNQMLSTSLTVDASEYTSATAVTPAVINTSFDDVVTDDLIEVAVTTAGTGVTYATVTMGFQLP